MSSDLANATSVCVFGLGEAGSLIAADLGRQGAEVTAYDPADVATPDGVTRFLHPALAVRRADAVLAVTAEADAKLALLQSIDAIPSDAVYADMSTSAPGLKSELASIAASEQLPFADVAMLSMVPNSGLATPSIAAGGGAARFAELVNPLGANVEPLDAPPGSAAARKLLRSVMMKGIGAAVVEAVSAGAAAGDLEWLWGNLRDEIEGADEAWLRRLVTGSKAHAARRKDEMLSARALLAELGVEPIMTAGAVEVLDGLIEGDLPDLPEPAGDDPTES